MAAYRAAYWMADDRQSSVLLTGPEDAALSDDELIGTALTEAAQARLDLSTGKIVIGEWIE
jgi:hypothetical protein